MIGISGGEPAPLPDDSRLAVVVWEGEALVGGIYGVTLGGYFGGESMFHRRSDASKAAVAHLVAHLKAHGFVLFDAQVMNPHLARIGAHIENDPLYPCIRPRDEAPDYARPMQLLAKELGFTDPVSGRSCLWRSPRSLHW